MSRERVRLDVLLVEQGYFPTRARAKAAIMAGHVFVDGQRVDKAGTAVLREASVEVRAPTNPYVSRGGLKLEWALDTFGVDPRERICLDVGASTGGFTDCLLQRGARLVYAVDVGYGQLAWRLRQDPRVRVHGADQLSPRPCRYRSRASSWPPSTSHSFHFSRCCPHYGEISSQTAMPSF